MTPDQPVLIGIVFATAGWLYTARRARSLARKQHTVNVMLQAAFNKEFRGSLVALAPHIKAKKCPDLEANDDLRAHVRFVLNHYEFVAAGLRAGDFDERLVRDSERGTIVALFETFQEHVWKQRDSRQRMTLYEHLEWLHGRWQRTPPNWFQRTCEAALARPWQGQRANPHAK